MTALPPRSFLFAAVAACALAPVAGIGAAPAEDGYAVLKRRCIQCHGDGATQGGLDLRTPAAARRGGRRGAAVVPGAPDRGLLLAVVTGKSRPQMPPTGALPPREVAALREWIAAGARYPAAGSGPEGWWAFRKPEVTPVPALRDHRIRTPVDAFILDRLRSEGLQPVAEASRAVWIRRAAFDLHGLPPAPEEIAAFVADERPDAHERLIDRLLASPRYGERWGRHWLDLARFAESEGFKADETRPTAWRYRDYVIQSFNDDKPYDRFVREQIAGDELYPGNPAALVATSFNRHWADESNARNIPLRRQEILNDITDTVGTVFLGLTLGCARCHDHKTDPISHRDYYRFQAYFAAVQPRDALTLDPPEEQARYAARRSAWEQQTRPLRERLAAIEAPLRRKLMAGKRMPFPPEVLEAVDTPDAARTALQWQLFLKVRPQLEISSEEVGKALSGGEKQEWEALQKQLAAHSSMLPAAPATTLGITDVGPRAPKTHVLAVGVYDQPMDEVVPGAPAAIRAPQPEPPRGLANSTGRRAALAGWIASAENPLTARVIVNRVWQQHFGRGLVPTASDFGKSGEAPSHPELLDWLAVWFARPRPDGAGWSWKALHRLLMTSSVYRLASTAGTPGAPGDRASSVDPDSRLYWRFSRRRLEGEAIRDACLAVSGELNLKMGGPSVFPELPPGITTRGGWPVTADRAERNRRSVYVFVRRNQRYPLFESFDFPDTHEPCSRRSVTNTAPQALMLLNSELLLTMAQSMAARLIRGSGTPAGRIDLAYRLAFGRGPTEPEAARALEFLESQAGLVAGRLARGEPVTLPSDESGKSEQDAARGAALVDFCHALMNANEFLYVD